MTRWILVSIAITSAVCGASWWLYQANYAALPEQVPTHFDWRFHPDAWTPKQDLFRTFLWLPAAMAGVIALGLALPWLSPRPFNVDRFRGTVGYVVMLVVALMGYLHLMFLYVALRAPGPEGTSRLLMAGMFFFFALVGNVLGKVRRNFWIGVRTPWTLASEAVWIRTHRLSAWLFVGVGVAGMLALLVGVPPLWCLLGLGVVLVVPIVYSAVEYHQLARHGEPAPE